MKHFISLGAGVQSSTMALMAKHGEITPMPDAAIFADTQAEPASVYEWLDWLEKQLPFPIYRVSKGNLATDALTMKRGYVRPLVPLWRSNGVPLWRHCTAEYKVLPIIRKLRELTGKRKVRQWIGISLDEADRMRPSRESWIENCWPLIEKRMKRKDCLDWMEAHNYPSPPRSACVFCPYHSDSEWLRLSPEEFTRAAEWEQQFQRVYSREPAFIHQSLVPLSEVSFRHERQLNLFRNECEGMCGV